MKLGYSNYGMRQIDIFESLARVRSIGYEAMEVCSRDGWQTAAVDFDMSSRRRLVASLKELNLPPPPVIDGISILGMATADAHSGIIQRARNTLRLVADLNFGHEPGLLTTTVGELTAGRGAHPYKSRRTTSWDSCKEIIRDGFLELADLAADFGVIVCVEAHAGSALATPTEARWLMENTGHDNLKVDFDISHFVTQSIDMNESVELLAPWSALTHVKDGHIVDGEVRFLLPGDGNMNLSDFVRSAVTNNLPEPIYVEVTRQISEKSGYDAWGTAEYCYRKLDDARVQAKSKS